MAATTFSSRNRVAPGALGRLSRNPAAPWRHIDMVLVGSVAAVSALGCLMIFSATRGRDPSDFDTSFLVKQVLFVGIGAAVMLGVALIDYRRYREIAPIAYGAILLAAAHGGHGPRQRAQGQPGVVPARPVPAPAVRAGEDRGDRVAWRR